MRFHLSKTTLSKTLVKARSWSHKIDFGMPWQLENVIKKKNLATPMAIYEYVCGMRCAYLESLLMTTKLAHLPFDMVRPSTKSIEISSQICYRIGSGCNNPIGLVWAVLRR